jgi:hypothetical protein
VVAGVVEELSSIISSMDVGDFAAGPPPLVVETIFAVGVVFSSTIFGRIS